MIKSVLVILFILHSSFSMALTNDTYNLVHEKTPNVFDAIHYFSKNVLFDEINYFLKNRSEVVVQEGKLVTNKKDIIQANIFKKRIKKYKHDLEKENLPYYYIDYIDLYDYFLDGDVLKFKEESRVKKYLNFSDYLLSMYDPGNYLYVNGLIIKRDYYGYIYDIDNLKKVILELLRPENLLAIADVDYKNDSLEVKECKSLLDIAVQISMAWAMEENQQEIDFILHKLEGINKVSPICFNEKPFEHKWLLQSLSNYYLKSSQAEKSAEIENLKNTRYPELIDNSNAHVQSLIERAGKLSSENKYEDAINVLESALPEAKSINNSDLMHSIDVLIASNYFANSDYSKGDNYVFNAATSVEYPYYLCDLYSVLAKSFQHRGRIDSSIVLMTQCIGLAEDDLMLFGSSLTKQGVGFSKLAVDHLSVILYKDFYKYLSELLYLSGDFNTAKKVDNKYKKIEQFYFQRGSFSLSKFDFGWSNSFKSFRAVRDKIIALSRESSKVNDEKRLESLLVEIDFYKLKLKNIVINTVDNKADSVKALGDLNTDDDVILLRKLTDNRNTAILRYRVVGNSINISITTSIFHSFRIIDISSIDLTQYVAKLRESLVDPASDPLPYAKILYRVLLSPIEKELNDANIKNVMVSLDGVLRYIPFAALHNGDAFAVDTWNFSIFTPAFSNAVLQNPTSDWSGVGYGASKSIDDLPALPYVRNELETIIRKDGHGVVDGALFLDNQFNNGTFKFASQKNFRLVHIASHFILNPGFDSDSYLLLGDGTHLSLKDLRTKNFHFEGVDLLTLSACDTALNITDSRGIEIEGFGVLAQRQGANAVIASLWSVNDKSTSHLMQNFYHLVVIDKFSKSESLSKAQRYLLHSTEFIHPYYWASFVLMGNWQ